VRISAFLFSTLFLLACDSATGPEESDSALPATVDVAENMSRFVFDSDPVLGNGLPAHGNNFITQGFLYPGGFLDTRDGVLADGGPAFPDEVIGEWTCRGYFVGQGAQTETGPVVITTQLFDFYVDQGYEDHKSSGWRNVVTEGYELIDLGVPVRRTMTGGTGLFAGATGEVEQELIGFNLSEGVNLRVYFDIQPPQLDPAPPCRTPQGSSAKCR
jgi:hypothetical protein